MHKSIDPVRAWSGVAILWLFYVLALMDRGAIALMVGPIMHDLAITPVQMGVLQGFAFAALYTLAGLPLGWAVDRVSRRKLLLAGILVWSAATIGCGFAASYSQMLVARAFVGVGEAVLIPTALSLIADMFRRDRVATATAMFSSGATIGSGAALMIGGVLLHNIQMGHAPSMLAGLAPWRAVFVMFGVFGVFAAWLCLLLPGGGPSLDDLGGNVRRSATAAEFGRFLRQHVGLLAYVLIAFPLLLAGMMAFMSWAPRHVELAFHWDVKTVGLVIGALKVIATPLGVICGGFAMDKALRSGVVAPYFTIPLVTTLIGGPLLAAGLLQPDSTLAIALLTVGMFVYSAYGSSHYVVLQLLAPPSMRGRLTGLYVVAMTLIGTGLGALLPPLTNKLAHTRGEDVGAATAYVILGVSVIVVIMLAFGRRRLQAALPGGTADHAFITAPTQPRS
jgi:predicted MFS family arabinose efflux permease